MNKLNQNSSAHVIWGTPSFWIERLPLYFGRHMGLFQKRGVYPEVRIFHGGPELMQAVRNKAIHVGEIGLPPFIKAFAEGLPARIIGSTFIQRLDHYLAARPGLRSLSALKGKKVGILSRGSCDEYFIRKLLASEDIQAETEVVLVPLGDAYGDLDCFRSGRIDAAFLVEPFLSLAESRGQVRIIARVGDNFPRYQWGGIFASEAYLEKRMDLLQALMDGYRDTMGTIIADIDAAAVFGSRLFNVPETVFRKALQRNVANWEHDARVDMFGLASTLNIQASLGGVSPGMRVSDLVSQL